MNDLKAASAEALNEDAYYELAFEFHRKEHPNGWDLTAFRPDRKGQDFGTFTPDTKDEYLAFRRKHADNNIYFGCVPIGQAKKAKKPDTLGKLCYGVWVDCDANKTKSIAEELARLHALATDSAKWPDGVPDPTYRIFSGGGWWFHFMWKEPILITEETLPQIEQINQWLVEKLDGDQSCWNIDRIAREPYSWNNPDAGKVAAGRTRQRGCIQAQEKRHRYLLSAFHEALKAPIRRKRKHDALESERGNVTVDVKAGDNVRRIKNMDELNQWNVRDREKVILVQGHHPDEPKESDNSRSMWVFDVCCNLVRAGVRDEVIYSMLTDENWGISESILEKGGNAEDYAIRQIERAKEEAIDPELANKNARFFVINDVGGKAAVCEWKTVERIERLSTRSFEAFEQAFRNQYVTGQNAKGDPIKVPVGKWWLDHPRRRTYENLVLDPASPRCSRKTASSTTTCGAATG